MSVFGQYVEEWFQNEVFASEDNPDFCDCIEPGKPCPFHNPDPHAEPERDLTR